MLMLLEEVKSATKAQLAIGIQMCEGCILGRPLVFRIHVSKTLKFLAGLLTK